MFRHLCGRLLPALLIGCFALSAQAGGRVEIVLVGGSQVGGEFHRWLEVVGNSGAARVQIRGSQPGDRPGIDVQGDPAHPIYVVTGVIAGRDELILPGARFRFGEAAQLARWVADLAENGPPGCPEPKVAFGLTAKQLQEVQDDLTQAVAFQTQDQTRAAVVERIASQLRHPVRLEAGAAKSLEEDKVAEELSGLSCGTVLACVVRPAGLMPGAPGHAPGIELCDRPGQSRPRALAHRPQTRAAQ